MNLNLRRARELELDLIRRVGALATGRDMLREYRRWLDDEGIHAEEDGWPSEEAYADSNVELFAECFGSMEAGDA